MPLPTLLHSANREALPGKSEALCPGTPRSVRDSRPARESPSVGDSDSASNPLDSDDEEERAAEDEEEPPAFVAEVDASALEVGKIMHSRCSVQVFAGQYKGESVAIKTYRNPRGMSAADRLAVQREVETLAGLSHPNLVRLVGVCSLRDKLKLVFELCQGGDLYELLHDSYHVDISWAQRCRMCSDVAKAMVYLHGQDPPIIHRDLTSPNILLTAPVHTREDVPEVKVSGFGFARLLPVQERWARRLTMEVGTVAWVAPEILSSCNYDESADVYSYGILLYEVLSRTPPFETMCEDEVMEFVRGGGRPDEEVIPASCPPRLTALMASCWDQLPKARPRFDEILGSLESACPSMAPAA